MREVCYERLRPSQLVAARTACPLAWLPCGILEWHGRHNPIGLDGVKAHALCVRLAGELGGLVWPPLWYGDNRDDILENVFTNERWQQLSYDHRPRVAEALGVSFEGILAEAERNRERGAWEPWTELLLHVLFQIQAYGFEKIVVMCGHYPLINPAREAARRFGEDPRGTAAVYPMIEVDPIRDAGYTGDHAARWETSLLLTLSPELVDLGELAGEPDEVLGVLGEDPRRATAAYGEEGIAKLIDALRTLLVL